MLIFIMDHSLVCYKMNKLGGGSAAQSRAKLIMLEIEKSELMVFDKIVIISKEEKI